MKIDKSYSKLDTPFSETPKKITCKSLLWFTLKSLWKSIIIFIACANVSLERESKKYHEKLSAFHDSNLALCSALFGSQATNWHSEPWQIDPMLSDFFI